MSLLISEYDVAVTSTEQLGKASITLLDINMMESVKALTLKCLKLQVYLQVTELCNALRCCILTSHDAATKSSLKLIHAV